MRLSIPLNSLLSSSCPLVSGLRVGGLLAATLLWAGFASAQTPQGPSAPGAQQKARTHSAKSHAAAKRAAPEPPPAPPAPNWPVNDHANPASVTWDSRGLRIEASNSSLQAILRQVSVATGTKVEGLGADQRVYGAYGPGQAREVLSQLLQGSGYNVLLAGDLGMGAPRQILLSSRHGGGAAPGGVTSPGQDANNNDEDAPPDNEVDEQPPPPPPQPMAPNQAPMQPGGFGSPGTVRTPQQVMEEMQQRQLQQQQQQQQQQQNNPPTNPQD
jgi:hypothetical protein